MKLFEFLQFILLLLIVCLTVSPIYSQQADLTGLPIIKNYLPSEHGGTPQNWAIVQDKRGIMYFANTGGLIEYDGSSWRIIKVENEVARTVAIDSTGTIFVGGVDQFGMLQPDHSGKMIYKSLINFIPIDERNFGDVWTIWTVTGGVFFQTKSHIFFYKNSIIYSDKINSEVVQIWKSKSIFSPAFVVNDKYYVAEIGTGLYSITNGSLKLIKGGEHFKDLTIYSMLPLMNDTKSDNQILIGTNEGFYIYGESGLIKFKTEADAYLASDKLYFRGAILRDDTYAYGTQNGGLVLLNKHGKLLKIINKTTGLNDNTVWFVYPSNAGELWLGLNNGIARINYPTSLTVFDSRFGLDGTLVSVNEHNDKLFVTSASGLFYANKSRTSDYKEIFKNIQGINSASWQILDAGDFQLVATTNGIYKLTDTKAEQINTSWRFAYSFCRSEIDKNIIYVGLHDGLAVLQFVNGAWSDGGKIPGISEIVQYVVEEDDGTIWLSTLNKGLIKIIPNKNGRITSYGITRYGKAEGITDKGLVPLKLSGKILFGGSNGFLVYNESENFFESDNTLGDNFTKGYRIEDAKADSYGNIWILGGKNRNVEISKLTITKNKKAALETFSILNTILVNDFYFVPYRIVPDKKLPNKLWITAGDKLYRFDVNYFNQYNEKVSYSTLIREVKTGTDSIIYFGGFNNASDVEKSEWNFNAGFSSIDFSYSIPSFTNESAHRYQYFLEDFDERWSDWTKDTHKEYTNLPSGSFVFHVRAMNASYEISKEAVFHFYIPAPWYKSNWAILIYLILILSGIWLLVNFRVKVLEKETVKLEAIVNERTKEVRQQKETLEEQAKKLVELDRLKTNFFTNISHEFRTPLTLVMGQIENILDSSSDEQVKYKLRTALSNSKRLHSLINQLLELSRLEAGEIKLNVANIELVNFLKKVFSAFESYAERKKLKMEFSSDCNSLLLYFDREKLEEIFNNLISNAIKFTPENGSIFLRIFERPSENKIEVIIEDSGVGINSESLPHIFDRFYQVDSSQTREYEGTGIGLAIVKELVELHHGEIKVESTTGVGTKFIIYLKKGSEHFRNKPFVEFISLSEKSENFISDKEAETPNENYLLNETEDVGIKDKEVVLVAEDNAEMRYYIQEQLEENFNVILAKNGEEGVNKAFESVPDLIITDVMMPVMNGYDLTLKIKNDRRTSHVPIIMLTAKADEDSKLKGLDLGVDDYLIKPFSKKELSARVGNLIKLRSLLKARYKEISAISIDEIEAKPMDHEFLEKVFNCIKHNLENPQFGVTFLADEVGLSVSQLNRKLNALINQSAGKLIRSTKLDYAAQLLKDKSGTISEIAFRVGFSDAPSFTHSFKEKFGYTPSELLRY